jgi:hypothetical protein
VNNASVISWDAVIGAVDYQVVVVDSNGNANLGSPLLSDAVTGGAVSLAAGVVFSGLAGGPYRVQVRALASADPADPENSDYSAVVNVVYDPNLPR